MIERSVVLILCFFVSFLTFSQEVDSLSAPADTSLVVKKLRPELFVELSDLNPKRAAFLSAVLPGMGQVYNRQYWKLPFVFGGAIIIGHYVKYNDRLLRSFRSAYFAQNDADPNTTVPFVYQQASQDIITRNIDQLRRDRDYLMIIGGLFYLLQIADAHISAHLHEFAINEELSMNIAPAIQPTALISRSVGVSISLNLK